MGIDEFFNKYLDGELTPEEDAEFRDLLAKDPLAVEHFHSMLLLHSVLKNDSENIKIPSDFEDKVEAHLLGSYLKMIPQIETRRFQRQKILYFTIVLFISFFFFVLDINDGKISSSSSMFLSELSKQEDFLRNLLQAQAQDGTKEKLFKSSNSAVALKSRNMLLAHSNIHDNKLSKYVSNQPDLIIKSNNLASNLTLLKSEDFARKVEPELVNGGISFDLNSNDKFYQLSKSYRVNNSNFFGKNFDVTLSQINLFVSGVHFSSFTSNDLFTFGTENVRSKRFANFVQSIGYSISEQLRLGIEFGYTELAFDQQTEILVPNSLKAPRVKLYERIKKKDFANNQILASESSSEGNSDNFVRVPIDVNFSQRLIWGGIFFEYLIPLNNFVRLVSRITIGSIDNGFYGFTRIFGEIGPVSGISLIFGTEGKTMWMQFPISSKSGFRTSLGLLYGVNFKLTF